MPSQFESTTFVKFFFSLLFLLVCCLCLMLYINKGIALSINILMQYCVLPRKTSFHIGGFHFAPLQARIFFQDIFFENENYSIRIVDGYFTFAFWGFWFHNPNWSVVHEYMISNDLVGTRCRVMLNLKYVKGTIVAVDVAKKKLLVRVDGGRSTAAHRGGEGSENGDDSAARATTHSNTSEVENIDHAFATNNTRWTGSAFEAKERISKRDTPIGHQMDGGLGVNADVDIGTDMVKVFDYGDVNIRSKPGRCQLHVNGMRFCLFNATGKYRDLATGQAAAAAARGGSQKAPPHPVGSKVMQRLFKVFKRRIKAKPAADLDAAAVHREEATRDELSREGAEKLQNHQRQNRTLMQRFFRFIGGVEMELFASSIDIGGVTAPHPYFLHIYFQRGEGLVYLTHDGCPSIDLYRVVTELTLQDVDIRMAQMDHSRSKKDKTRSTPLKHRAQLMFRGAPEAATTNVAESYSEVSSNMIQNYGIVLNGKDRNLIHLVFYRDVPNVYAGETITRDTPLPRTGVEVTIDAVKIRYGPWLEYCRSQLWQYFLPPNYRPLEPLQFVMGKARPNAGFEFFVEFARLTKLEVPFKRRAVTPSPPFGIVDSGQKGVITATIGEGSQYIQKAQYLLPGEKKQNLSALFMGKNMTVWANCVLERETILAHVESLQFFLDREDDIFWNGLKLWNILPKISNAEVYWYMSYVDFFMNLLDDWRFAPNMYYHIPLTTEEFNTYASAVELFIPNVKRFEVFFDGFLTVYINVNTNNVIYSEDPNSLDENIFLALKVQTGYFFMTFPSDDYQLSEENTIERSLEVCVQEANAFLSLPSSHPVWSEVNVEAPWFYLEKFKLSGTFVVNVGNQSVPQDRSPMDPRTHRTKHTNYLNLEAEFINVRGTLMGPHIKAIVNFLQNLFLDHTLAIGPDELFWLLARLQSHAATGKNKRKEFLQFLQRDQPEGNFMEIFVAVRMIDMDASLTTSQTAEALGLNLVTSNLTFTYVKQFAVTDTAVTLTPITARFFNSEGNLIQSHDQFLCIGAICVGLVKHFGPMPLKPKIHEGFSISVDGVSFSVTLEQLAVLTQLLVTVMEHIVAEDTRMAEEVGAAHTEAELAAEGIWKGPTRRVHEEQRRQNFSPSGGVERMPVAEPKTPFTKQSKETNNSAAVSLHSTEVSSPSAPVSTAANNLYGSTSKLRKRRRVFFSSASRGESSSDDEDDTHVSQPMALINQIPLEIASSFAQYMEELNKADDASKDYGIFFLQMQITNISGCLKVKEDSYISVELPTGVSMASSTVNDSNSNKRLSVVVENLSVRALVAGGDASLPSPSSSLATPPAEMEYAEVFFISTSLFVRQCVAYPFDGSLEAHMAKQRKFIEENDYESLICFQFADPVDNAEGASGGADDGRAAADSPVRHADAAAADPPTLARPSKTAVPTATPPASHEAVAAGGPAVASTSRSSKSLAPPETARALATARSTRLQSSRSRRNASESSPSNEDNGEVSIPTATPSDDGVLSEPLEDDLASKESSHEWKTTEIEKDLTTTADVFRSCVSVSSSSSTSDTETHTLPNNAFASEGKSEPSASQDTLKTITPTSPQAAGSPNAATATFKTREPIPARRFYRTFIHSSARDLDISVLDYVPPKHVTPRQPVRTRVHFNAQLPFVGFTPNQAPNRFPSFMTADSELKDEQDDEGDEVEDGDADSVAWARRTVDNRRRSQADITTKHSHLESSQPVVGMINHEAILLGITAFISFNETNVRLASHYNPANRQKAAAPRTSSEILLRQSTFLLASQRERKKKSRARIRQKRWSLETQIMSFYFPCVEFKVLSSLPVPSANLPTGVPVDGMYVSTVVASQVKGVQQQNRPPAGVEAPVDKKQSGSLTFAALALITQIEYEPLARKGNITTPIPHVTYDTSKDTMAIAYLSEGRIRGQHDVKRGVEGLVCRIDIGRIGLHMTRDFVAYAAAVRDVARSSAELFKHYTIAIPAGAALGRGHVEADSELSSPVAESPQSSRRPEAYGNTSTIRVNLGYGGNLNTFEQGKTIQGKGSIMQIDVLLIDSRKELDGIAVDLAAASRFEVHRPSANFSLRTPNRLRDSNLVLQFVGQVDAVKVRLYPTLLSVVRPPPPPLKKASSSWGFSQSSGTASPGMVKVRHLNSDNISFSEASSSPDGSQRPTVKEDAVPLSGSQAGLRKIRFVYSGSFAVRLLDACVMHSKLNYVQLNGKNLTGCAEMRPEKVSSQECVQTEVLTEAISEGLRERLRYKANRARERARRSRYTAPPSVTAQLQLKSTASFFSEQITLRYIADVLMDSNASPKLPDLDKTSHLADRSSQVVVAVIENLGMATASTDQFEMYGEQVNIRITVGKLLLHLPYRHEAPEIVQPQLRQIVAAWRNAAKLFRSSMPRTMSPTETPNSATPPVPSTKISAVLFNFQAHSFEAIFGLPQNISQCFRLLGLSAFVEHSSDKRMSIKLHAYPFTITSSIDESDKPPVILPHMYLCYGEDDIKVITTFMVETIAFTVTPQFVNHVLLTYEKISSDIIATFSKSVLVSEHDQSDAEQTTSTLLSSPNQSQHNEFANQKPGKRQSFLFLLQGLRISYLTSATNMRFSIRRLNATGDTSQKETRRLLNWVVNVINAQVALVDRDDHDQEAASTSNAEQQHRRQQEMLRSESTWAATASPQESFGANSPTASPQENTPAMAAAEMRAQHPLGGFIWGSTECSFTLASGKTDVNAGNKIFDGNVSFKQYSPELQKALMDSIGKSSSKWELSIYSPLAIMRVGLVGLLQKSLEETRLDIGQMKADAMEEDNAFRLRIQKSHTFQKLVDEKRKYDFLLKQSEKRRMERLRRMTARVARDSSQRRNGFAEFQNEKDGYDILSLSTEHKFVATITDFLLVVPFGDAAYRSVLEEQPSAYACNRKARHIHTASCLNREKFIPSLALKMRVEDVSLIFDLRSEKRFVPLITPFDITREEASASQRTRIDYTSSYKLCGRFLANNTHCYFTDGTTIEEDASLPQLIQDTSVLGGLGTLTSRNGAEYRRSLDRFSVASVEAPIRIEQKNKVTLIGAVLDLSGPKVQLSSRCVSIFSQLAREFTFVSLWSQPRPAPPSGPAHSPPASTAGGPTAAEPTPAPPPESAAELHIDVSARVDPGVIRVYSFVTKEEPLPEITSPATRRFNRKTHSILGRRRVEFDTDKLTPTQKMALDLKVDPDMSCILSVPLPACAVQAVVGTSTQLSVEDVTIVRAEIRASPVELSPSITALAQEIDDCANVYDQHQLERGKKILETVGHFEKRAAEMNVPLHCSIADMLLPMPRALVSTLAEVRVADVVQFSQKAKTREKAPSAEEKPGVVAKKSFTAIHISLTGLRVIFTGDPLVSTVFTVSLDDGGSVDLVLKFFARPLPKASFFISKYPQSSLSLNVRRLRAECQTKLEVKSLEMSLPEAEMCISRRLGSIGFITTVSVNLPFNVDGAEANMMLRMQHMSQLFLIHQLWTKTFQQTQQSVSHIFARGNSGSEAVRAVVDSPFAQTIGERLATQVKHEAKKVVQQDQRLMVTVLISHGLFQVDMGSGNTHQTRIGTARLALEEVRNVKGSKIYIILGSISNVGLRSEGVLSGVAEINDIMLQSFLIQNPSGGEYFFRSPEQRTFREALCVQHVQVTFKERQVRDVFECKVGNFRGNSMDGIGAEGYTSSDIDIAVTKGTLGATPSTVPAFIAFVRSTSLLIAQQKQTAIDKLKEGISARQTSSAFTKQMKDMVKEYEKQATNSSKTAADVALPAEAEASASDEESSDEGGVVPFMGNRVLRIPCGQMRLSITETQLLLGAISSGEAATGCVVVSFPRARVSFAECPSESYAAVKKMLMLETFSLELYRPGTPRSVIMGFKGVNNLEFYTRQELGEREVGFTLKLSQTHPWTGNPRFQDFEEIVGLIRSFTNKRNADVFQQFGKVEGNLHGQTAAALENNGDVWKNVSPHGSEPDNGTASASKVRSDNPVVGAPLTATAKVISADERVLRALRTVNFSPQLRFGGDVSVNTEVILNWLGITEKMLPNVMNARICDALEKSLYNFANLVSERTTKPS